MNKKITFEQFLKTFNFRRYVGYSEEFKKEVYDTQVIRVYLPQEDFCYKENEWFEFGVYDFSRLENKIDICKKVFNKEILDSYVQDIQYNIYDNSLALEISLSKKGKFDE